MELIEKYSSFLKELNGIIDGLKDKELCELLEAIGFKKFGKQWKYDGNYDKLCIYYSQQEIQTKLNRFFIHNIDKKIWQIYSKGSSYTVLINNVVIPYLIEKCFSINYDIENEYYRIDVIGYENCKNNNRYDDKLSKLKLNKYIWNLEIAVEHENVYGDWIDEAVKLSHIKCNYRIIIGYNKLYGVKWKCDEDVSKERVEHDKNCLRVVSDIFGDNDIFSQNKKNGKMAFFFGNGNENKPTHENLDYKGYVLDFDSHEIKEL